MEDLKSIKREIENVGGKIAGVVINKVPTNTKKYYDKKYYYGENGKVYKDSKTAKRQNPKHSENSQRDNETEINLKQKVEEIIRNDKDSKRNYELNEEHEDNTDKDNNDSDKTKENSDDTIKETIITQDTEIGENIKNEETNNNENNVETNNNENNQETNNNENNQEINNNENN